MTLPQVVNFPKSFDFKYKDNNTLKENEVGYVIGYVQCLFYKIYEINFLKAIY